MRPWRLRRPDRFCCITHHDGLFVAMVTVYRAHGFRIIIFVDDHAPAHVHVFGDGHIKINLVGANSAPEIVTIEGMKHGDVRRSMRIVVEQQQYLLSRWREIHG